MARSKESEIVAQLKEHIGTMPVKLFTELLREKENTLLEQLVTELDPKIQGRIMECRDLRKCLSKDFS